MCHNDTVYFQRKYYDRDYDYDDYRSDERESSSFFNEKMKRKGKNKGKGTFIRCYSKVEGQHVQESGTLVHVNLNQI